MALDFPANPTNGQAYGSYIYNSTVGAWQSKEDPATVATVSTTSPATGNQGDIWYDNNDGTSYVYYSDGTSGQWVELLSSGVPLLETKANLSGGNLFTDAQSITASTISQVPLTINGMSGQTGNLQEWKDNAGTLITRITNTGDFVTNNRATVGATSSIGSTWLYVQSRFASDTGVVVRGQTSQTGDLQQWQNSGGTVLAEVDSAGVITAPRFVSGIATGTAPLTLSSTTLVTNLNADLLDGQHRDTAANVNTIASRDANGRTMFKGIAVSSSLTDLTNDSPWYGVGTTNFAMADATAGQNATQLAGYFGLNLKTSQNELRVGYQNNGNGLLFNGNRVSHAGNINLAPLQPAFFVGRSSSTAVNNTILFDLIKTNVGSYYNSTNGRFTAPIAGTYYFNFGTIGATSGTTRINPRINNANFWGNFQLRSINTANFGDASVSFCFTLAAGDYVTLYVSESSAYDDGTGYTHWSGHMIG